MIAAFLSCFQVQGPPAGTNFLQVTAMVVVTENKPASNPSALMHLNNEHTLRNLKHDSQYPNTLKTGAPQKSMIM